MYGEVFKDPGELVFTTSFIGSLFLIFQVANLKDHGEGDTCLNLVTNVPFRIRGRILDGTLLFNCIFSRITYRYS